ncbi:HNH endonuclease [Salmonella enterica]|uniref:HNH nuclease domain-containing protein n=1 Tax=Salmonella phage STML-13-1 TaxID=1204530 RepID=K4I2I0_9CAUD|nr:homing endonuclease [Salmonella phage STML-13-1]AFU64176.1 hypothetical protein [Salmonella phage STML-13-1]EBI9227185.1 HNH endonuclease [Salmonella enterica]
MNYKKIYNNLIERSRNRTLVGYKERHHIVPRCLGGGDELNNIAVLTPEEHYIAHLLLVKLNPGNYKLVYAAQMMCVSGSKVKRSNKSFGWLRRKFSEESSKAGKLRYENDPELRERDSLRAKHMFSHNPELKKLISERVVQAYEANPLLRSNASERAKASHANNPSRKEEHSARMKKLHETNQNLRNNVGSILPWERYKTKGDALEIWKKADKYYEWWLSNQKGYKLMGKAFGYQDATTSHKNLVKKFRSGWNPKEDVSWIKLSKG